MKIRFVLMTALALAGYACGDDDGATTDTTDSDAFVPETDGFVPTEDMEVAMTTSTLSLSFDGLPDLGPDFVYEGWILVDDAPVTTGRFTVTDGVLEPATFEVDAEQAAAASAFVLTIEPAVGDDPAPTDTHVLAGDLAAGSASLTIGHAAALGDDFSGAAGTFLLATPTSEATDDDAQGIWYVDPSGDAPMASLTLPTLPAGWAYEGWVVDVSGDEPAPVSTGTFLVFDAADSDGAGATAGPGDAPPFPGQDFIDPARDLTVDHMAVISIEPVPDDSPAPFQLKPLAVGIGAGVGMANPHTFDLAIAGNTISGTATFGE